MVAVDALLSGARESLAANSGSVVVISSVHAHATTGGVTAYATSKAALEGWVRSAALDLGPGIRVNAVAPGRLTPRSFTTDSRGGVSSRQKIDWLWSANGPLCTGSDNRMTSPGLSHSSLVTMPASSPGRS